MQLTMDLSGHIRAALERHPFAKSVAKLVTDPFRRGESGTYRRLADGDRETVSATLRGAWRAEEIPLRQRAGVDRSLEAYRAGAPSADFDSLVMVLRSLGNRARLAGRPLNSVLEVGCASGYYSEVLAIKGIELLYFGCDYSAPLIALAKRCYPDLDFRVEDATRLRYPDASFDVVISGCCLLHIPEFQSAILETARVARQFAIFLRTPILHNTPTKYFRKRAYGVETIEIHFNEGQFVDLLCGANLRVIGVSTLNAAWRSGDSYATKSYVCEKVND